MRFIQGETRYDFLGKRAQCAIFSAILIAVAIGSLLIHGGPNYGIDFKGGSLVQIKFDKPVLLNEVRAAIGELSIGEFSVQEFGAPEEVIINVERSENNAEGLNAGQLVEKALAAKYGKGFTVERVEMVGPKVGKDLREKALLSIFYALAGILIYITIRFELKFGLAAIAALAHDTVVTLGAFSIFDKELTLPVIAAILTVIGYSLNDTIVVFDRIRENIKMKRGMKTESILNISVNQTLSRTILTSGTTIIVVLSIFFLGGEVIHDFSFALLVGVMVGTYSSIFVASPLLLIWSDRAAAKKGVHGSRK